MTHNQIDFQNYKEIVRHNLVSEQEMSRHNLAYESETNRHNVATEGETNRHNLVSEDQEYQQLAINDASQRELARHNLEMENIGYVNAASGALQAQASLSQAGASWAQAGVAQTNASVNKQNADTRRYEAETGRLSQRETQRNNLRQNRIDRSKLRNETRATSSKIKTERSQRFDNYVNAITGGYRNVQTGNSSLINSLSNMIGSGVRALGGLVK